MKAALVEHRKAETQLERTIITSEVNGRSLGCDAEVGEHVQAGEVCGEIYGTDVMEVPVSIPVRDLEWLDANILLAARSGELQDADLHIPATVEWERQGNHDVQQWTGYVQRQEAGLEAATRMAKLVVQVHNDQLPAGEMRLDINMFCRVKILGRQLAEAFVLPRNAIQPDGTVFLVKDGKLAAQTVTIARLSESQAMILPDGGLTAGDRVITSPVPKAVIGMSVKVLESSVPAATPADEVASTQAQ